MAPATENRNPKKKKEPNPKLRNFLFQMVLSSETDEKVAEIIKWTKKSNLEFQLVNRQEVARRWGVHKGNKKNMDYESLSRSLRSYYGKIMKKIPGKDFRYQFIADGWTKQQMALANSKKNNFSIAAILGPEAKK
uniref:ETS domain-containing protein n=1 Tax=Caenorhabditis tropicalis TaxID=1561998 RepID=A0A1I7UZ87_9PELO